MKGSFLYVWNCLSSLPGFWFPFCVGPSNEAIISQPLWKFCFEEKETKTNEQTDICGITSFKMPLLYFGSPTHSFSQHFHSNTNDIFHAHGASYAVSMYYSYKLVTLKETFVPTFEKKKNVITATSLPLGTNSLAVLGHTEPLRSWIVFFFFNAKSPQTVAAGTHP